MSNTDQQSNNHSSMSAGTPPAQEGWVPPRARISSLVIAALIAAGGCSAVLAAWKLPPFDTTVVSTDNAYVRGQTTIISPQVSGYVSEVLVHDYQHLEAGAVIARIDDQMYRQQVDEAEAKLHVAEANLSNNQQAIAQRVAEVATAEALIESAKAQYVKANADFERAQQLVEAGPGTVSQLDSARAQRDVAQASVAQAVAGRESALQNLKFSQVTTETLTAEVETARAQVHLAEINAGWTAIVAPEKGQLSDVTVRRGQYVTSGTQLLFLVPEERWVTANFKERDTSKIVVGQKAWFTVDGLAGTRFWGVVEMISPAAGSEFTILRTDTSVGNFTKIPQRISVKIKIDPHQPEFERLRPGMSVEAYIDTDMGPDQ